MTATTRILLGLHAGEAPEGGIALAARLAASLRAAIHGLLVEEPGLVDAAALPFTRIISRTGAHGPDFSTVTLERALALTERTCRDMLCAMAQPAHVPWTMQRERGDLAATLSACMETGDIVVMPQAGGSGSYRRAMVDVRLMTRRARGVVIVRKSGSATQIHSGPVVAIDDGSDAGAGSVSLAAQLAAGMNRPLQVIVFAGTAAEAEAIQQRARAVASPRSSVRFHRLSPDHSGALSLKLRMLAPSLVVAEIEAEPLRDDASVLELQRASSAPLLLLGRSAPGNVP
jgi:hypothetical protein